MARLRAHDGSTSSLLLDSKRRKHIIGLVALGSVLWNLYRAQQISSQSAAARIEASRALEDLNTTTFSATTDISFPSKAKAAEEEATSDIVSHESTAPLGETSSSRPNTTHQDPISLTSSSSSCLQHNSKAWLEGPRIGNTPDVVLDPEVTERDLQESIIHSPDLLRLNSSSRYKTATQSTLCHPDSRLLKTITANATDPDQRVFAAIHYHQVKHAIPEAKARWEDSGCASQLQQYQIHPYDYECPNARHVVVNVGSPGLGANVKGGVAVALLMGLATDRVAHVLTNVYTPEGKPPSNLSGPRHYPFGAWDLASCPRRDYQCVFQPLTPCVLTMEDFEKGHVITQQEYSVFRSGKIPPNLEHHKVLVYQNSFAKIRTPFVAKTAIDRYISEVLDPTAPALSWMVSGFARSDPLSRTATLYALRLLPKSRQQVTEMVSSLGPSLQSAAPFRTIGLPIRASDKCQMESQCLTYLEHLQAATDVWHQTRAQLFEDDEPVSVIVTTESLRIRQDHLGFTAQQSTSSSPQHPFHRYSFLSNSFEENPPDGGNSNPFKSNQLDADQAMIGSLASLHLQLHATLFVGNACSNYHYVLADLVAAGCGASRSRRNSFYFLQQAKNPWFRVCCWTKNAGKECVAERERFRPNATTAAQAEG